MLMLVMSYGNYIGVFDRLPSQMTKSAIHFLILVLATGAFIKLE
jgi:hypothetical protein